MGLEFIYGLKADNEEKFFYAGRTDNLSRRMAEHKADGYEQGTPKQRKIFQLQEADVGFKFVILEAGTPSQLQEKEELWRVNLLAAGHPLTNTRAGDSPLLEFEPGEFIALTVERLANANWVKDDPKAQSGEYSCWINGIQFFKRGGSRLRFWSAQYGTWTVECYPRDMQTRYSHAVKMLTVNTPENNKLREQVASIKAMRG